MNVFADFGSPGPGGDRKPVTVPRPSSHGGIGAALREAYGTPTLPDEFARLLERLK